MEQNIIKIEDFKNNERFVYSVQGNPRQAALCYIAGIIDGEGTIRIHKAKPYLKNKNKNYTYFAKKRCLCQPLCVIIKLYSDTSAWILSCLVPRNPACARFNTPED